MYLPYITQHTSFSWCPVIAVAVLDPLPTSYCIGRKSVYFPSVRRSVRAI